MTPRQQLRALLRASRRIVAFTGAGISTESGIPDFRSPGGIWSRMKPIEFSDFLSSEAARRESWRRRLESDSFGNKQPNRGHHALAELHRRGRLRAVITQNVDSLHQASGLPERCVIELHGNAGYTTCLTCARRYELADMLLEFRRTETAPRCAACGGLVKTATISFGQMLPEPAMVRADEASADCDLFLVLGTSLVVFPAAGYPLLAKRAGAKLAIVNREPTEFDELADLVVNDEIGDTLSEAVGDDAGGGGAAGGGEWSADRETTG